MMKSACAVLVLCATVGLAAPRNGGDARISAPSHQDRLTTAGFADDGDQGLLYDNPPTLLLRGHSRGALNGDWLRFETDVCGRLQRVDSRHTMLRQSAFENDMDQYDENDPANEARQMVGQWLSQHAEIAVMNDGVDKTCDDAEIVDGDGDTLEFA